MVPKNEFYFYKTRSGEVNSKLSLNISSKSVSVEKYKSSGEVTSNSIEEDLKSSLEVNYPYIICTRSLHN